MTDSNAQPLCRVRVFVDFWNFTLSIKNQDAVYKIDWAKVGGLLAAEAANVAAPKSRHSYEGTHVFASYDPNKPSDQKLKHFLTHTLNRMTGMNVTVLERQKKRNYPKCPNCQAETKECHSCNADMRGTEEKGVDTRLVTDMIRFAWADAYDVAVLVSADKDFVPVVQFLQNKGIKIVHAAFPPHGSHLSQKCWDNLDIPKLMPKFKR